MHGRRTGVRGQGFVGTPLSAQSNLRIKVAPRIKYYSSLTEFSVEDFFVPRPRGAAIYVTYKTMASFLLL